MAQLRGFLISAKLLAGGFMTLKLFYGIGGALALGAVATVVSVRGEPAAGNAPSPRSSSAGFGRA